MIHECYRFEGFDADAFRALVTLLRPTRSGVSGLGTPKRSGLLVVVVDDDGAVLGAVHSRRGRIPNLRSGADPEAIAHVHLADRVIVLREGALEDLAERIALRVRREHDYLAQVFTVVESLRELERAGTLRTYPGTLARIPLPPPETLRHALDLIASDGNAFVLCVHGERGLENAYAVRRRDGSFDAIVGPRRIEAWTGSLPGTFDGDHRAVVAAVHRELAPVQLALSVRREVAHKLITQRSPGALSAAVAAKDLLADPAPSWLALGVGIDTVASALAGVSQAIEGSPLGDALGALFSSSRNATLPGLEALESWLELFATRVRR